MAEIIERGGNVAANATIVGALLGCLMGIENLPTEYV